MSVERPRLLFVVDDDSYFCSHRLDLGKAARAAGFDVSVAAYVQQHGKRIEDEGFTLFPIRLRRGLQSPLQEWHAFIELIHLYRRVQPHLIHHVALKQVLFGGIAARLVRAPAMVNAITGLGYIFSTDGWRTTLLRSAVKPALQWALAHRRSAVILQNAEDREDLLRARVIKSSQAIIIRGAGVNVSQFRPSPEPVGTPVVVLASRLLRSKGVEEFVRAAKLLKRSGTPARYVLVGAVDEYNPSTFTEEEVRRWEQDGIIEWWGHQDDMLRAFTSAHIVVLPSYSEGLPKVLLEAAACARPLIATRVRGCREIVRHGENGLLVPIKDPHALAEAITTLLHDKCLRARMGARGREIVVTEFSADQIAGETIAVYRRLLGNTWTVSPPMGDDMIRPRVRETETSKKAGRPDDIMVMSDPHVTVNTGDRESRTMQRQKR